MEATRILFFIHVKVWVIYYLVWSNNSMGKITAYADLQHIHLYNQGVVWASYTRIHNHTQSYFVLSFNKESVLGHYTWW